MLDMRKGNFLVAIPALCGVLTLACSGPGNEPWRAENDRVAKAHNVVTRERDVATVPTPLLLGPGEPRERGQLPKVNISDGVTATLAWGQGALMEVVEMQAGAVYPEIQLNEELITWVLDGSATGSVDGQQVELGKDAIIYLTPGSKRSLEAGPNGLKAVEVYSPVRLDHLSLAGVELPDGIDVTFPDLGVQPSLEAGRVYNANEIQFTPLTDPDAANAYPRSPAYARLIWGKNAQLSFVRMDPASSFPHHAHPEDQLTTMMRGSLSQGIMEKTLPFTAAQGNTVLLPGGMVHAADNGEFGADQLDVFWPVRPDYVERATKQRDLLSQVIDPGVKPVKLAEGFTFAEGPTWLNGKLYFSDMYFADPANGDWTGSPAQSRLIVMTPDGEWKVLSKGMQTNGTIAAPNGNLIVCDMFGHRVVEMDPATGRVVKVLLDKVDGKPIDGPNDLVMDSKGGIYITDPQFTAEPQKSQPGTQVYYLPPSGEAKVVIPAGEYAMPNGVELSPDGKTLYVDNTWLQPGENFVWAYDVQEDGSLTGKRKFAQLHLTPDVLDAAEPANRFDSRADGTAVDTDGRYYVCTKSGVQIFDKAGVYIGTIWTPEFPVSATFGGENNDVLYMVGGSSVWSIQTKVQGHAGR